jgi:integral membrane protein
LYGASELNLVVSPLAVQPIKKHRMSTSTTVKSPAALNRFRLIAWLEGLSYLLLLFIAMPLKYLADMPLAVKYTGWAHGLLFVLYMIVLLEVAIRYKWSLKQMALGFIASLLPFGPFIFDKKCLH